MSKWLRSLCFNATLVLALAGSARAAEVIHQFDSTVQLAKDGTLTVTETLRVRAEGREIKRGIFRDFPMTFTDAGGREREVDFQLLGVTRDGKYEPHFTERKQRFVRIYAGAKDVFVTPGDHVYVIQYTTGRQVRWFDGKPELNWNVTGNFWNFPIAAVTYRLKLVDGARPLRFTAFTGVRGAKGKEWQGAIDNAGVLTVATTRQLAPSEGLTVVAALLDTAVDPISPQQAFWYSVSDNRHWLLGGVGFVLILIYYLVAWGAVGRDPKRGTIIPLFHPPQGISPALANYIHRWGFGREKWRAFTAAALSLAVRGLIHFDNNGAKLLLKSTGKNVAAATLPPGERVIFDKVSAAGTVTIDSAHGATVAAIGKQFTSAVETESKDRFFRRNLGFVIGGVAMTIVVLVCVVAFGGLQDADTGILIGIGAGGFIVGIFVVPVLVSAFNGASIATLVRGALPIVAIAVFLYISTNFMHLRSSTSLSEALTFVWRILSGYPFGFVLAIAFTALNGLFYYLMRAPTALGRPVMDALDGFTLYLETAEKDRLNYQAPEFTTERFETLLPYAVALNVEKPWSDAFAAALSRAHPGDADPMRHYQPVWGGGSNWSGAGFGTAIAATVGSVSSALASAVPVSSGSSGFSGGGGGGGSGGGGGGGGGGGW